MEARGDVVARMIPKNLVKNAVLEILRSSPEPASIRDLVTAVYYRTGEDRVGYSGVTSALQFLAADLLVKKSSDGRWQAVTS